MSNSNADVVVIGGGAAGIAAAHRLRAEGVDALLVEARHAPRGPRLDGRRRRGLSARSRLRLAALGRSESLGRDRGGAGSKNRSHAAALGTPLCSQRVSRGRRRPHVGDAAVSANGRQRSKKTNRTAPPSEYLEPGDRWNPMIDAVSTWYSGAELDRVSARDLERYVDTGVNWRVVEGYGSVVATHGADLRVELDCKVERLDHRGRDLRVETSRGAVTAQAVVVTLPSALIAEDEDFFLPALPEKTRAAAGLPLGLADKLFLALSGHEAFEPDSRAFGADRSHGDGGLSVPTARPAADRMLFRRRACGRTRNGRRSGVPRFRGRRTRRTVRRRLRAPRRAARVALLGSSIRCRGAPTPTRCRAGPTIVRRWRRRSKTGSFLPARPAREPTFPPRTARSGPGSRRPKQAIEALRRARVGAAGRVAL